jgi:hypothetical protein
VAAARGQARRGDLVVVAADSGYWPGEVTGVTRAGDVRLWRAARKAPGLPGSGDQLDLAAAARVYVVPATLIEVRGALATAAVHTLPGAAAAGMPYPTPGDLYAALRPHLRSSPVADFLRRAALQREAAIEAAARSAAAHHPGPGGTQADAGAAFRAAVAAADHSYRQALSLATHGPDRNPARGRGSRLRRRSGRAAAPLDLEPGP